MYDAIKEARRQDDDAPQGEWRYARKTADYAQVIRLASEALATRTKDLQLASWLTEALLRREGFPGLKAGLELVSALLDRFWDHLHPLPDDGDATMRAELLAWIGQRLDIQVRFVPINRSGHDLLKYLESRAVGYEVDCGNDYHKQESRKKAIAAGKLTAEEFDRGWEATPKVWYRELLAGLDGCVEALRSLDDIGQVRFGSEAPSYSRLREALEEVRQTGEQLLQRKLLVDPDVPAPDPAAAAPAEIASFGPAEGRPAATMQRRLEMEGLSGAFGDVSWSDGAVGSEAVSLERLLEEAGGRPERAIELLVRGLAHEATQRGRFLRKVQLARIMVDAGMENVARPILEELVAQIDAHHLEEWEAGELVGKPLALLYRCLMKGDGDVSARQQLYLRICRVDPLQAITLGQGVTR